MECPPPKECPVCGSTELQSSNRQNARSPGEPSEDPGILSYRCEKGHVFTPPPLWNSWFVSTSALQLHGLGESSAPNLRDSGHS